MYTFGYLREATQAHIDLDEQETQAMHLQERYHIFANEAMQAICAIKPKYEYFKCKVVKAYEPVINLTDNKFRKATEDEINWESRTTPDMTPEEIEALRPNFADDVDTKLWYEGQHIYLLNSPVRMPDEYIAFAEKQAWAFIHNKRFDPELFIANNWGPRVNDIVTRVRATKEHFMYGGRNTLMFFQVGEYWIPYKAIWYRFKSGIDDAEVIDMPVDIFLTIPLYIAALCLQMDHAQRALSKRSEFEMALARCSTTDFLDLKRVSG